MKTLGTTYIETVTELPTKLVNGQQRYKWVKMWVQIPHELIDPAHLRKLTSMIHTSTDGFVEMKVEAKNPNYYTPKYYLLRANVQEHITLTKE